ncbi:hypothetical protein FOCC_FOCC015883 [Frankliniella occidentalis]|nr:hypothetical protein FOCC_FOCC015883 [Frankliniella occidentalis]
MTKKQVVKCPFAECPAVYRNVKSFTAHLSRNHRGVCLAPSQNTPLLANSNEDEEVVSQDDIQNDNDVDLLFLNDLSERTSNIPSTSISESDLILHNLAQFCMRLEYHYLVPETVVQYSVTEMFKVHAQGQAFLREELTKNMRNEKISEEKMKSILDNSFARDPFKMNFDSNLSSTYRRKEYFKKMFTFVKPEKVEFFKPVKNSCGNIVNVKKFFYYVPVPDTLEACLKDKSLNIKLVPPTFSKDGFLVDVTDGEVFKNNKFFQENPTAFCLALYQDGVEIVNAIGPAKRKHKLLAIYLAILNLPEHLRSHINSIKLVALCREKDFVHDAVYGRIVEDLKKLETVGINVPDLGNVKAGLLFIAGDNLGSHGLGGFLENFSRSIYFCRYCIIDRPSFKRAGGESRVFTARTPAMYNEAVRKGQGKKSGYQGVKFNSVFNSLQSFHCCSPGLPGCFGHDLMEGICAFDLKLYIDHFIAEEWFTLCELNEAINSFPYSSRDKKDKPIPVQEGSERVKGGAWQVWTLLRLLPLIILEHVLDPTDRYWKALLLLLEIVEIVCAPQIHKSHLPYLQFSIDEYLTLRRELFPNVVLRPKHHYLTYYPELILKFGPLIKCWTMRFESKHTFFKRIARMIRNFKNILFSFSLKHELLQCYLRTGADTVLPLEVFKASDFIPSHYSRLIVNIVMKSMKSLSNVQLCQSAKFKGTSYANGDIVILSQESYQCDLSFGRIIFILFDCIESVFFVCEKLETLFDISQRLYRLGSVEGYVCVKPESLLSYYPHHAYEINSQQYVKLKHAIVCTPE